MENGLPLVSIVTISFNAEKVIQRTLDSILNLDYENVEVVFVDGLSTDNTVNIIKSFFERLDAKGYTYKFISEKDTGIYNAMNKGQNLVQGESLIFMNSGDYFHPQFSLNQLVRQIDVSRYIVVGYSIQVFNNLYFLRTRSSMEHHLLQYPAHQAIFVPRTVYKQLSFNEHLKIAADYFWIKSAMKIGDTQVYRNVISVFELGGKSSSSSFSDIYLLHRETNEGNIIAKTIAKYLFFKLLGSELAFKLLYSKKYKLLNKEDAFNKQII